MYDTVAADFDLSNLPEIRKKRALQMVRNMRKKARRTTGTNAPTTLEEPRAGTSNEAAYVPSPQFSPIKRKSNPSHTPVKKSAKTDTPIRSKRSAASNHADAVESSGGYMVTPIRSKRSAAPNSLRESSLKGKMRR